MLEKELQKGIVDIAHLFGWHVAHFRTAINKRGVYMTPVGADGKGFPDLIMLRPPRILVAEIKVKYNKPTAEQKVWLEKWGDVPGVEVHVWTEKDYPDRCMTLLR